MLGLGIPEMILILIVALLIFGPKKLPEIGRSVGSAMREFKKGVNDMKESFDNVIPEEEQPGFGQAAPASMGAAAPATDQQAAPIQPAASGSASAAENAPTTVDSSGTQNVAETASSASVAAAEPKADGKPAE